MHICILEDFGGEYWQKDWNIIKFLLKVREAMFMLIDSPDPS
jgi:hypothetical protein